MERRRWFRRAVAFAVVVVMLVSLSVPSYAADVPDGEGNPPEAGSTSGENTGASTNTDLDSDTDTDGGSETISPPDEAEEQPYVEKEEPAGADAPEAPAPVEQESVKTAAAQASPVEESSGIDLTQGMKKAKADMAQLHLAEAVSGMTGDEDYVNHEIIYSAANKTEAAVVAEAYDGIVTSFSEGIAVIKTAEDIVDALEKAEDTSNDFPAVYPNMIYKLYEEEPVAPAQGSSEEQSEAGVTTESTEPQTAPKEENGAPPASPDTRQETAEAAPSSAEVNPEDIETVFDRSEVTAADIRAFEARQAPDFVDASDVKNFGDIVPMASKPNDPYSNLQWFHNNIGTYDAWSRSKGKGVTVAVIDSGINTTHPDLKNNIKAAYSTARYAINGAVDNDGHGTHVAGIIAAQAGNKIGVAGVAPQAKIISVKALDYVWTTDGLAVGGSSADVIRAINLAVSKGAQVINMSLGGSVYAGAESLAVANAIKKGVVIVAAAGNDNVNIASSGGKNDSYPAEFPNVISVSAAAQGGAKAGYSNYGNGKITIGAPGGDGLGTGRIASTYKANSYIWMSGTSMAAPVVTGVVALLLGQNSAYKNGKSMARVTYITNILKESANRAGSYSNTANFGAGLVNANSATANLAGVVLPPTTFTVGGGATLSGTTITTTNTTAEAIINLSGGGVPGKTKYYYTVNGNTPTLASAEGASVKIKANGKKSITVKAVASVNGKLSKVKTQTYKLRVNVSALTLKSKTGILGVGVGRTLALTTVISPSAPGNKTLTYASSNKTVATVDKKGVVTAKKIGTADITVKNAYSGVVSPVARVTVYPLTKKLALSAKSIKLATTPYTVKGVTTPSSAMLVATPAPAGTMTGAANFAYKSSNSKIATVDASGKVTAVASGKVTVTVTARDGSKKSAACAVTVIKRAKIKAVTNKEKQPTGTSYVVGKGKTINLTAVLEDKKATNAKVVWGQVNKSIARVDNGAVTGVSAGTTAITVRTADGIDPTVLTINITVKPAATKLTSSAAKATLKIPGKQSLAWTIKNSAAGAHETQYIYTSKNKKVATVTGSGKTVTINAVGKGTTDIIAKAVDGSGKSTTIKVTVQKLVTSFSLAEAKTLGLAYGKSLTFKASVLPADASNKALKWGVTNTTYFKIDSKSGRLTLKKRPPSGDYLRQFTKVFATSADGNVSARKYVQIGGQDAWIGAYVNPISSVRFAGSTIKTKKKDYAKYSMYEGSYTTAIKPYYETNSWWPDVYKMVDITSSNNRVAQMVWYGDTCVIEAYSPGKAKITARALDGSGKSDTLVVTVKPRGGKLK